MMPIKKTLQQFPIFLISIPLVFLINNANYYYKLLDWSLVIVPSILYLLIPLPIYYILVRVFRSSNKAGLFTGFLLAIFYFFTAFHRWLRESFLSFLSRYSIQLPFLLIVLILLFLYFRSSRHSFVKLVFRVNLVFLLLFVAGLLQLGYKYFTKSELLNDQADPEKKLSAEYIACDTCNKPDIYYILMDGYTNTVTLQAEFGYDNSAIEKFLKSKGFHCSDPSRSNYNFTHMSMASVFNLNYLSRLDNSKDFYTKEFLQSYYTMYENEWCRILKKEGYDIKNFSIFNFRNEPVRVTPFLTELSYRSVPGQTFFNKLDRDIGWKLNTILHSPEKIRKGERKYADDNIRRINETYTGVLSETKRKDSVPRFIYAHFLLPHETFYFDSLGNRLPLLYSLRTQLNKKDYVNQLVYTNKFIIEPLVDSILKNNHRPAVIILQGDHGYRNYPNEKTALEFENFNAIYCPGRGYSAFDSTHTSVNTFRIISNNYFNQRFPLLKDSSINLMKVRSQ